MITIVASGGSGSGFRKVEVQLPGHVAEIVPKVIEVLAQYFSAVEEATGAAR